eukprot:scaffold2928_cov304-Prasinococcus_capsulatus_cf.AAC.3
MDNEEAFDQVLMSVAQQLGNASAGGIEAMLDVYFGFLRRRTDFFSASEEKVNEAVLAAAKRQLKVVEKDKEAQEKRRKERQAREDAARTMRCADHFQRKAVLA